MTEFSITSALNVLNPLVDALESAYWDTSEISIKDRVFDLVLCIHAELNELAKLSVDDLNLPYEVITPSLAESKSKIKQLAENIDENFPRSSTARALEKALADTSGLLRSVSG